MLLAIHDSRQLQSSCGGTIMSVPNFIVIHPRAVEIFDSKPPISTSSWCQMKLNAARMENLRTMNDEFGAILSSRGWDTFLENAALQAKLRKHQKLLGFWEPLIYIPNFMPISLCWPWAQITAKMQNVHKFLLLLCCFLTEIVDYHLLTICEKAVSMTPITKPSRLTAFSMWKRTVESLTASGSSGSCEAPFFVSAWYGLPFLARQIGGALLGFSSKWQISPRRSLMRRWRSLEAMMAAPEPACPSNTPQKWRGIPVPS